MHTVEFPINRTFAENHDVLSQSPCFVGEHVFDLAKLFIKGGGTSLCWYVLWLIKHLPIPVDIETVAQSYYFNTKEKAKKEWCWVRTGQANISSWFPSYQSYSRPGPASENQSIFLGTYPPEGPFPPTNPW